LRREHVGVYTVGHPDPSPQGTYRSAVLAAGIGAHVSHGACAHLLVIVRGKAPPPEVTVPTTAHRRRPGIVIHRVRALPSLDTATLDGIPITPRLAFCSTSRRGPSRTSWLERVTRRGSVTG